MEGSNDANPDILLSSVAAATSADPVMLSLRQTVLEGFPNEKCNLPLELRPFWQVRSQLSVDDAEGLILVGPRVVIPTSLRQEIIRRLLQMHQGATKLLLAHLAQSVSHLIRRSLFFPMLRLPDRSSLYSSISAHTAVVIF